MRAEYVEKSSEEAVGEGEGAGRRKVRVAVGGLSGLLRLGSDKIVRVQLKFALLHLNLRVRVKALRLGFGKCANRIRLGFWSGRTMLLMRA